MSKEALDQFIQKVTDDEQLQARIGDEIDAESLIALGAECGCEFTAEELQESVELSEDELDGVAGGLGVDTTPPNVFRLRRNSTLGFFSQGWDNPA
jgi:predicted ribosomally synthesized peptide with nif11-like leader